MEYRRGGYLPCCYQTLAVQAHSLLYYAYAAESSAMERLESAAARGLAALSIEMESGDWAPGETRREVVQHRPGSRRTTRGPWRTV